MPEPPGDDGRRRVRVPLPERSEPGAGGPERAGCGRVRALELYRDDYLIEDLYEDWTIVERERLSNACVDMLGRLAACYFDARKTQECVEVCYRTLDKDY